MHGYPLRHRLHGKERRLAAVVLTDSSSNHTEDVIPQATASIHNKLSTLLPVLGFTVEQYAQLMHSLHKQANESLKTAHTSFMVGN